MSATATISYVAEIKDLRNKLASVSDVTRAEAQKMVRDLNTSIKAVEKAQKEATAAARGFATDTAAASKTMGQLGLAARSTAQQIPDVISQISAGTPPLTVFTQQGLQVAQVNMGLLGTAAKATAGIMTGPWGLAVAGAVAAGSALAGTIQQNDLEMRAFEESLDGTYQKLDPARIAEATKAWAGFADVVQSAQLALYAATGALTTEEASAAKAVEQARELARVKLLEAGARYSVLEVQRQEIQAAVDSGRLSLAEEAAAQARLSTLRTQVEEGRAAIDAIKSQVAADIESINANYNQVAAIKEREKATKSLTSSIKALSAAEAEMTAQFVGWTEFQATKNAAAFEEQQRQNEESIASQEERTQAEADAAKAFQVQIDAVRASRKREAEEAVQLVAMQQAAYFDLASSVSSIAGSLSTIFDVAGLEQAGTAAFLIAQGIAAAEAAVNTILAMSRAATIAPPPANIPFIAAAAAFGAAQEAAIAAVTVQHFADTPFPIQAGGSGMSASFAPGDVVVAGRTVDDVDRQLERSGARGGGAQIYVLDSYRHLDRWGRDAMRSPQVYESVRRQARRIVGRR